MKTLLRSVFAADVQDNAVLMLDNYRALDVSGLGFESPQEILLWTFIRDFVISHQHVPDIATIRAHFERIREMEVVDTLERVATSRPRFKGDFISHLENKANDRRSRLAVEILKNAGTIISTGIQEDVGKEKKFLRGPVDAMRYVLDKAHDIVTPTMGTRLSGNVTKDGLDFMSEYERVEADPLAGIGQFSGLQQMDQALQGAKRYELWTHAAFTGHLKCVTGDTRIFDLSTGHLRTVKDIYESGDSPFVHALDEGCWDITQAQASPVVESGVRPVLRVQTEMGRMIRVSENHPFMTPTGWQNASNLTPGDWVAVAGELQSPERISPLSDAEVALIGYLLGDGHIKESITFTNQNVEILADFISCLEDLGYLEANSPKKSRAATFRFVPGSGDTRVPALRVSKSDGNSPRHPWVSRIRVLLESLGLWGCTSADKFIPGSLWEISDAQVCVLLSALWSTDGCIGVLPRVRKGKADVLQVTLSYTTKSHNLARDVQALLQRVGVQSTVSPVTAWYQKERRIYWAVNITTAHDKKAFLQMTDVVGKRDQVQAALAALGNRGGQDYMPPSLLSTLPDGLRVPDQNGGWYYARWAKAKAKVDRATVLRFAQGSEDAELLKKARGPVKWERLKVVAPDGEEMTYDLSVPGPANFVANGFFTHNSTLMLNWAYNQAIWYKHDVLIFSLEMPYSQCRRILYSMHSGHEKFKSIHPPVDYIKIRDGQMSPEEKAFMKEHVIPDMTENPEYGGIHIEVADPDKVDFTVADLRSKAELIYSKSPFSMLFVDHALLMSPRRWVPSTTERINEVIRDMKKLALGFNKGMGMAVVLLFQISREGFKAAEKGGGRYNLTHLSYSNECLPGNCLITGSGGLVPVVSIRPGDRVWSRSGWKDVKDTFEQGVKPVWEVTTDQGSRFEASPNHRVRVLQDGVMGWCAVQDLQVGDWLVSSRGTYPWPQKAPKLPPLETRKYEKPQGEQGIPLAVPQRMTPELAYLLGAWDGDGCVHPKGVGFTGNRKEAHVRDLIRNLFFTTFHHEIGVTEPPSRPGSFDLLKWSQPLKRWFEGVAGVQGAEVPPVIFKSPRRMVLQYLKGLFDTDGWITNAHNIGLRMKSESFLRQVQTLLCLLGYDTKLSMSRNHLNVTDQDYEGWNLIIRGWGSKVQFAREIGFTEPWKAARLQEYMDKPPKRKRSDQVYPFVREFQQLLSTHLPYRLIQEAGLSPSVFNQRRRAQERGVVPEDTIRYALSFVRDLGTWDEQCAWWEDMLNNHHVMRVVSVKDMGRQEPMYDIEVGGDHEYQSGCLLSHNCERSSDIVTATWIDDELRKKGQVSIMCLKSRDQQPFEPFRGAVFWPTRRITTLLDAFVEQISSKSTVEQDVLEET